VVPGAQVDAQVPIEHISRAPQARLHIPQWALEELVSTHRPPQRVCPMGQGGSVQAPAVQTCPIGHARLHIPQCALDVFVSTQVPAQRVVPIAHVGATSGTVSGVTSGAMSGVTSGAVSGITSMPASWESSAAGLSGAASGKGELEDEPPHAAWSAATGSANQSHRTLMPGNLLGWTTPSPHGQSGNSTQRRYQRRGEFERLLLHGKCVLCPRSRGPSTVSVCTFSVHTLTGHRWGRLVGVPGA